MRRLFPILCVLLLGLAAVAQAAPAETGDLLMNVHDRDGRAVAGVRLTLQPSGRVMMTDGKGAAKFTGLPPGAYTVGVAVAGYPPGVVSGTMAVNLSSRLDLTLERGDVPRSATPPPEYMLTPPVSPGSGLAWRVAQEAVLQEAALRYDLWANSNNVRRYRVYYLSGPEFPQGSAMAGGDNPDAAFLQRFRGSTPPLRAVSALTTSSRDWGNAARHHWIIFRVPSLQWTGDTCVDINAGSEVSGSLSTVSLLLTCTLRNGWWVITREVGLSI